MVFERRSVKMSVYDGTSPCVKVKDVLKTCERDCSSLCSWDHAVIMGGVNDIAINETKNCTTT